MRFRFNNRIPTPKCANTDEKFIIRTRPNFKQLFTINLTDRITNKRYSIRQ